MKISQFGFLPDGREVISYLLESKTGSSVEILNYGGIWRSLRLPTPSGDFLDPVLGFDDIAGYLSDQAYIGALIGRFGNRIGAGKLKIGEASYELEVNNGGNHLHGGTEGFDKKIWAVEPFENEAGEGLILTYVSADGEEHYPGQLTMEVRYHWSHDHYLSIQYQARTTRTTVLNPTHHAYFNLHGKGSILDHELVLEADAFVPVSEKVLPTGELRPVEGTPFDFRDAKPIGRDIGQAYDQLDFGGGYDHSFVVRGEKGQLRKAAWCKSPLSGLEMEVYTTEPGVQLYTANWLNDPNGKAGQHYQAREAFCLETQHYPDSPNRPEFPSTVLEPGEVFVSETQYRFSFGS
ncbi:MAG: aldose epimerase family protein [Bacteroidota bacterium]